jgi:hypothetical protein
MGSEKTGHFHFITGRWQHSYQNKTCVRNSNRFLSQVLLSIVLVWTLCAILTVSDAFQTGSPARTDNKINILYEAPWFRFPSPVNSSKRKVLHNLK